jgi:hypothetical protein
MAQPAVQLPKAPGHASAAIHRQITPWTLAARITSHSACQKRGVLVMNSLRLLAGLILSFLGGCTAGKWPMLAFAPDEVRKRAAQRQVEPRSKTKTTKHLQPPPPAPPVVASEPTLPAWSAPSPKPSRVLRSTLTPGELFTKVSPAVYAVAAVGQPPRQVTSHGSAVAVSPKDAITN